MRHELGADAVSFIRSELAQGRDLAALITKLPLEQGSVVTFLPASVGAQELGDFGSGGVAGGDQNENLAQLIGAYLGSDVKRICVFEHPAARRGDPVRSSDFFTVGDTVLTFVTAVASQSRVERAAREAHWYPGIGILSSLREGEPPIPPQSVQPESCLVDLVANIEHLLIGAYDAEGWLVWSKPGSTLAL